MSSMKDTILRNAEQLGMTIRLKRKERGLSQNKLAELLGVERKWVLRLEAGNPKAEFGLVLKTLNVLSLRASLGDEDRPPSRKDRETPTSRLDEVFQRLQRPVRK
jgi:HTH-type transcriptional regulator / antitoxin HipB